MGLLLPILILIPLVGGLLTWWLRPKTADGGFAPAIVVAVATLVVNIILAVQIWNLPPLQLQDVGANASVKPRLLFAPEFFSVALPALKTMGTAKWQLQLGVDSFGLSMALLTSLMTLAVLIIAAGSITKQRASYAALVLLTESALLGVFLAMDLVTFYACFELTLLPLLVLIAGWGTDAAWPAARKFMLYTLAGSLPMIVALMSIVFTNPVAENQYSVSIPALSSVVATTNSKLATPVVAEKEDGREAKVKAQFDQQKWVFVLLVLGLGIKMAILPLHTWLPTTYFSAHPTTAALLAAVVLKLGLFGFLRLALPLVPIATQTFGPGYLGWLAVLAIILGALAALGQTDLRLLLAYSSLSHVGFITLGLFSLTTAGITGAALQMFNHGITTGALFLLASMIIARRGNVAFDAAPGGLAAVYPKLAVLFVFFTMAGAGMPGLNNFVGELLALSGMSAVSWKLTALAATGIVLGAWYALRLVQKLFFGPSDGAATKATGVAARDVGFGEIFAVLPAVALSLIIGIFPQYALRVFEPDVRAISALYNSDEIRLSAESNEPVEGLASSVRSELE